METGKFDLSLEVKRTSQEVEELFRVDLRFHNPWEKETTRSGSIQQNGVEKMPAVSLLES